MLTCLAVFSAVKGLLLWGEREGLAKALPAILGSRTLKGRLCRRLYSKLS